LIDRTLADELVPLDGLRPGQWARVDQLVGCPEHVRRLEEMGLRAGMLVQMLRRGRPCIVRAGGNRLCFRCSKRLGVWVRLDCDTAEEIEVTPLRSVSSRPLTSHGVQ
jgi:Fe2+ transport system protein FeoA